MLFFRTLKRSTVPGEHSCILQEAGIFRGVNSSLSFLNVFFSNYLCRISLPLRLYTPGQHWHLTQDGLEQGALYRSG